MFELQQVSWQGRLHEVSLSLEAGMRVALIGPNGAGKSSLLQMLAGQQTPDEGRVSLSGRPLSAWTAAEQARWRAWLPQDGAPPAPLTGEQLLSLGMLPDARVIPGRRAEIEEVLALSSLLPRRLETLSGGERQRLHLGRVLMQAWGRAAPHPRALFLDESLAALDIRHRMRLLAALVRWCETGELALVWSSHDLNEALAHSTHAWLLAAGRLVAAGETGTVMEAERLSRVFKWPIQRLRTPQGPVLLARGG